RQSITFDAATSYHGNAPTNGNVKFEWMFNWNGTPASFVPNVTITAAPNVAPAQLSYSPPSAAGYTAPGTYKAGLRVTDNNSPANVTYTSITVVIQVTNNAPTCV